nr:hypothetical protein HK105_007402 [Polyrhizophydium stewartii]
MALDAGHGIGRRPHHHIGRRCRRKQLCATTRLCDARAAAVVLALAATAAAVRLDLSSDPIVRPDQGQSRQRTATPNGLGEVLLAGGYRTCFYVNLTVQGTQVSVSVDAGSTDTAVGSAGLNNYDATAGGVSIARPSSAQTVTDTYADGSWWTGYGVQTSVGLPGARVSANNAPVAVITSQSTSPVFVTGSGSPPAQGLMGLAYAPLSSFRFSPASVVDAWVASGTMAKDEIAMHACPYTQMSDAYIDFGNDVPSTECNPTGAPLAWAKCPTKSYFTLDVRNVSVNGQIVALPSTFQTTDSHVIGGSSKAWSIIDSCSTMLRVPSTVNSALQNAVRASGGLPSYMTSSQVSGLLSASYAYTIGSGINWAALPTLSFDLVSDQIDANGLNKVLTLTLTGRQYLQCDENRFCASECF